MEVIAVLDLAGGQVVRGVGGRRAEYRPVESELCASADPLAVARAFERRFGIRRLYVADLDAIAGRPPAIALYRRLAEAGFTLAVDAGLRTAAAVEPLLQAGAALAVAGLETLRGPADLAEMIARYGADRMLFSLDLKAGRPLGKLDDWKTCDPLEIAVGAARLGARRTLILDLARVGMAEGTRTEELLVQLRHRRPEQEVYVGGGVRGLADLRLLEGLGAAGVLIASALHDGHITAGDLAQLASKRP